MKKLIPLLTIFMLGSGTSISTAQTSLFAGLNVAESTNVGFWGVNPTVEVQQNITTNTTVDLRLNGFLDIAPKESEPELRGKEYHRSFYADLGLNVRLIDRSVDWIIGAGGSYQIGGERYISTASYYGGELIDYRFEETDFSGFGIFIKNSVEFNRSVSLNLTVYRYSFLGEYISFGPSFKIR